MNENFDYAPEGYFYPEMIPDPDYSDTADETVSSEEDEGNPYLTPPHTPRHAQDVENLRDTTEVYVRNVEVEKTKDKPAGDKSSPKPNPATQLPKAPPATKKVGDKPEAPPATKKVVDKPKAAPATQKVEDRPKAATPTKTVEERPKAPPAIKKVEDGPKTPPPARKPAVQTKGKKQVSHAPVRKPPASAVKKGKASSPGGVKKTVPAKKPQPKGDPGGDTAHPKKTTSAKSSPASTDHSEDEREELIKPKKPVNPYLSSTERQQLHKELRFNQKYGRPGGGSQKTELQLALEKYTQSRARRNLELGPKNSLEKILELQARKIEMQESKDETPAWMERLQRPPTMLDPKEDEFYRVHARVVSSNPLTHCFLDSDEEYNCS